MSDLALVDTNVLVYALFEDAEHHLASRTLLGRATDPAAGLCLLPQNVVEFCSAVTNPRRVSEPKTPEEARQAVNDLIALPGLSILPVPTDVVARFLALLERRPRAGAKVHDLSLVAAMLGNGISTIFTFNTDDFAPIDELTVLTPSNA